MKGYTAAALIISGLGLLGLIFTLTSSGNVRDYIAKHYRVQPDEKLDAQARPTKVFKSADSVARTARDISGAHKPAERRTTPEGVFLRYSDDIVSILPVTGGSRILVDDEDTGYRRNYFFVGGYWGRYSGPAESFRGGGPGVGK